MTAFFCLAIIFDMIKFILPWIFGFISPSSHASEVWKIQKIESGAPAASFSKKTNFPSDTLIEHPLYSAQALKAWSCAQGSGPQVEVLTCTPTANIETSDIFLAINRRYGQTKNSIQGSLEQFRKNPNRTTSMKAINGDQWVFSTQEIDNGRKVKQWTVVSIKNGVEFIVHANVPVSDLSKHQSSIEKILDSLLLK